MKRKRNAVFSEEKLTLKGPRFFAPFSSMEKGKKKKKNCFGRVWEKVGNLTNLDLAYCQKQKIDLKLVYCFENLLDVLLH